MKSSSFCLLLLSIACVPAAAAESPWRLGIAAGYGERSNPLVLSDDIPIAIDIDIAWFGKRFFFDNGDLGYTFANNELVTGSLVARFNSDRVFFGKTETGSGPRLRRRGGIRVAERRPLGVSAVHRTSRRER